MDLRASECLQLTVARRLPSVQGVHIGSLKAGRRVPPQEIRERVISLQLQPDLCRRRLMFGPGLGLSAISTPATPKGRLRHLRPSWSPTFVEPMFSSVHVAVYVGSAIDAFIYLAFRAPAFVSLSYVTCMYYFNVVPHRF